MEALKNLIPESMRDSIGRPPTLDELLISPGIREFVEKNRKDIDYEMLKNSYSRLNEFYNARNNADQTGMAPVLHMNFGYIDVSYTKTAKRLGQEAERAAVRNITNNTMANPVRKANFKDIHFTENRKRLISEVKQFITEYHAYPTEAYKGLFVSGTFGVGKTYILSAMANQLAKLGHECRIEHFPTFMTNLRSLDFQSQSDAVNDLKKVEVLILDDFGSDNLTEHVRDSIILVIVEHRMNNELPTFFTSNLTMKELQAYLANTKEGNSTMKANRIMERINFLARELILTGTNKRVKGVN